MERRAVAPPRELETDGGEAEEFDGAGDKFAVEGARDEDGYAVVAEATGAGEQGAVPEGEDRRAGDGDADGGCRGVDVSIAPGEAEQPDDQHGEARDDSQGEALGEGVGHRLSLVESGGCGVLAGPKPSSKPTCRERDPGEPVLD